MGLFIPITIESSLLIYILGHYPDACLVFSSIEFGLISLDADEKYFAREVTMCKDDSKSFTRDRLNDDFCDCVDGTDEPGMLFAFQFLVV